MVIKWIGLKYWSYARFSWSLANFYRWVSILSVYFLLSIQDSNLANQTFICAKSAIETLKKSVKYVES